MSCKDSQAEEKPPGFVLQGVKLTAAASKEGGEDLRFGVCGWTPRGAPQMDLGWGKVLALVSSVGDAQEVQDIARGHPKNLLFPDRSASRTILATKTPSCGHRQGGDRVTWGLQVPWGALAGPPPAQPPVPSSAQISWHSFPGTPQSLRVP